MLTLDNAKMNMETQKSGPAWEVTPEKPAWSLVKKRISVTDKSSEVLGGKGKLTNICETSQ